MASTLGKRYFGCRHQKFAAEFHSGKSRGHRIHCSTREIKKNGLCEASWGLYWLEKSTVVPIFYFTSFYTAF